MRRANEQTRQTDGASTSQRSKDERLVWAGIKRMRANTAVMLVALLRPREQRTKTAARTASQ